MTKEDIRENEVFERLETVLARLDTTLKQVAIDGIKIESEGVDKIDVKERPIKFKDEMVRAILNGTKTMTRRVIKPQPSHIIINPVELAQGFVRDSGRNYAPIKCPYGVAGDHLWVKEAFELKNIGGKIPLYVLRYSADDTTSHFLSPAQVNGMRAGKHTPVDMPQWASRITLEVTSIKVERVQDISNADAVREGMIDDDNTTMRPDFRVLWNIINSKEYSWEVNPWVWVVSFERVE